MWFVLDVLILALALGLVVPTACLTYLYITDPELYFAIVHDEIKSHKDYVEWQKRMGRL